MSATAIRTPAAWLLTAVLAVAVAGCGGGGAAGGGRTAGGRAGRRGPAFVGVPASRLQRVPGAPFGVVVTPDGRYALVDLLQGRVLVMSLRSDVARPVRSITLPGETAVSLLRPRGRHRSTEFSDEAVGSSLTRDGRLLLVADGGQGAVVLSVARAESGSTHPVLGTLSPPSGAHLSAEGAIETASSADGRYVFVSLEYGTAGGVVAVYRIGSTSAPRFGSGDFIGSIPLGQAVVGATLSPDGRYLYVTSELAGRLGRHLARGVPDRIGQDGTLSVIDVATAEHDPARAVLSTVPAMNQPVRVAVSPDGSTVWVTARGSNRLLAFSAARLLSDPARAMIAEVRVGTAPVGVATFDGGERVLVADSNRFDAPGAHAALTIVDVRAALAHRPSVIATLRSGLFPREVAVNPARPLVLISNFGSGQLETVTGAG